MGEYTCAGNFRAESVPGRVWQPNLSMRPAHDSDPGAVARSLWLRVATLMNDGRTLRELRVGTRGRSQLVIVLLLDHKGMGIYVHSRWQKFVAKEFMAEADCDNPSAPMLSVNANPIPVGNHGFPLPLRLVSRPSSTPFGDGANDFKRHLGFAVEGQQSIDFLLDIRQLRVAKPLNDG